MRYNEIISELFDTRVSYEWIRSTGAECVAGFVVDGYEYLSKFTRSEDTVLGFGWDFVFEMRFDSGRGIEFSDSGVESVGILGTGGAPRVFASILRIMDDFIRRVSPEYIVFSAQEGSRRKLYRRMVSSLLTKYSIYKRIGEHGDDSLFIISRIPDHDSVHDLFTI